MNKGVTGHKKVEFILSHFGSNKKDHLFQTQFYNSSSQDPCSIFPVWPGEDHHGIAQTGTNLRACFHDQVEALMGGIKAAEKTKDPLAAQCRELSMEDARVKRLQSPTLETMRGHDRRNMLIEGTNRLRLRLTDAVNQRCLATKAPA
jgi:hypothetical protein